MVWAYVTGLFCGVFAGIDIALFYLTMKKNPGKVNNLGSAVPGSGIYYYVKYGR